jgi:major membrane immunogen (membrane-anchored lipoprotein)
VNRFLENDFLEILVEQSNIYHSQYKYKNSSKSLASEDVSITGVKKFLPVIIFMGHVKKGKTRHYWSTNK